MVGVRTTGPPEVVADEISRWDEADYVVVTAGRFDVSSRSSASTGTGCWTSRTIRGCREVVSTESFLYLELWKQLYDWGVGVSRGQRHAAMTSMAPDRLIEVVKEFPELRAVDGISLEIPRGSFFALLGPSGCGKTTTLRMIGGFEEPTSGQIFLADRDVVGLPPYKRDVNTVFQSYALFPHMSIADNVAFGLERRGIEERDPHARGRGARARRPRGPREAEADAALGRPAAAVALARAIVNNPRVLLLDEPLGALDLKLRKQMQLELKRIQNEVGITFVHVTHDQEEAMTMADTIAVMNQGEIEQLGARTSCTSAADGVRRRLPRQVEPPRRARRRRRLVVRLATARSCARGRTAPRARSRSASARRRSPSRARGEQAPQARSRVGVHRRRDRGRRRDGGRRADRVPPERRGGRRRPAAGEVTISWSPDATFVVESNGESTNTMRMTRRELVQRGAAAPRSQPPRAPRRRGGGGGGAGAEAPPTRSASRTGSSTSTSTRRRRSRRRSRSSPSRPGSRSSTSRRSTRTTSTSGRSRGRSRRATRSTARSS